MKRLGLMALLCAAAVGFATAAPAQETLVKVGAARSIGNAGTLIAIDRGYFKEAGIKVEIEEADSSANIIALLAQGKFQIVEGGMSAGFFNAIEKDLPVIVAMDRASTPLNHNIMLRPDLKDQIKDARGLKGKVVATNGPGSVSTYEIGKVMERHGLSLADVELKILPFTQMAVAFNNKAIDAGLLIPPFSGQLASQGYAVPFIDPDDYVVPTPVALAVNMINTDWAKANPELLKKYYVAYMRGVRDYCQAYHSGPNRQYVIDLLIKTGTERRPEVLHQYPWASRDVLGKINVESLLDMQAWYQKNKFTTGQFPAQRLVDASYATYAAEKLGPFVLENKDSKLKGCR
jgi:NitT/TauT family transport system substrate-binding protein